MLNMLAIKMTKSFTLGFVMLMVIGFCTVSFGQGNREQFIWTKTILPTVSSGCRIEITDNDISPDAKFCYFEGHMKAGSKLELIFTRKENKWIKLRFKNEENEHFVIYVENQSNSKYKRIFDKLFSRKEIKSAYPGCGVRTTRETIFHVGFPTYFSRTTDEEKWHFNADYVAFGFCNYDETLLEFKNGKLIKLSGTI